MSAVTRPRGPLPSRVYWARRLFALLVLLVAVALVWATARLLGGSGGGGAESASPVVAERSPSTTATTGAASPSPSPEGKTRASRKPKKERLARPTATCDDSDVVVTPEVLDSHVGRRIVFALQVTTVEAEACFWEVSAESVFLTISDAKGPLWSSQDCPEAIDTQQVVPRREKAAEVLVRWNGRQSDSTCSDATPYVRRGEYEATAVARGSVTPVEVAFELVAPETRTETITPTPTATPDAEPSRKPREGRRR